MGSNKIIEIDVRFIAASNKDLEELISKGEFRQDLFYRLNVFPVNLPPLRERRDDIPLLLDHFLKIHSRDRNLLPKSFSQDAIKILMKYDWPGNIREVENLVERLSTLCKEPIIHLKDLPMFTITKTEIKDMPLKAAVKTFEKQYVGAVLESVNWNRTRAAKILGIHRNTLLAKINELDMKI